MNLRVVTDQQEARRGSSCPQAEYFGEAKRNHGLQVGTPVCCSKAVRFSSERLKAATTLVFSAFLAARVKTLAQRSRPTMPTFIRARGHFRFHLLPAVHSTQSWY